MKYKILDEILEQPSVLKKTFESEIELMDDISELIKNVDKIYLIGSGSSISSCYSVNDAIRMYSTVNVECYLGYEFYYDKKLINNENSIAIFASQSGETEDTLAALEKSKEYNIKSIAVCNEPESTLVKNADISVITRCGTEIGILGTKTHLTQLSCLYYMLFKSIDCDEIIEELLNLPEILNDLIDKTHDEYKNLAYEYKDENMFYCLGNGPNYGLAYKTAMTIFMEGSNVDACPEYTSEFRHGLIERVQENVTLIFLDSDFESDVISKKSIKFCQSINANCIILNLDDFAKVNKILSPFILLIPLEWFGCYLAHYKGIDPGVARHIGILPY